MQKNIDIYRYSQLRRIQICAFSAATIYSEDRRQAKQATREALEDFLAQGYGRYVSIEEQALDLEPGDWLDMTHLASTGREKLTMCIAQELSSP